MDPVQCDREAVDDLGRQVVRILEQHQPAAEERIQSGPKTEHEDRLRQWAETAVTRSVGERPEKAIAPVQLLFVGDAVHDVERAIERRQRRRATLEITEAMNGPAAFERSDQLAVKNFPT